MKNFNKKYVYLPLLLIPLFLFVKYCGKKTIEQQVESLIKSEDKWDRRKIAHSLADSVNVRAPELLLGLHTNPKAIEAIDTMLTRYSFIIEERPIDEEKALDCIRFITAPSSQENISVNEQKIKFIINALRFPNLHEGYKHTLIESAKSHGPNAAERIVQAWVESPDVEPLKEAILGLGSDAVPLLANRITSDSRAIDLLAQMGSPAVNHMIAKMNDNEQAVRFAAGDVLVRMMQYDKSAVEYLTAAIDNSGIDIVARNYPFYIRLGKPGTEKLLLTALDRYFNTTMGLDYLNCGNLELEEGATKIAAKNGYNVVPSVGSHGGPKWGSGN